MPSSRPPHPIRASTPHAVSPLSERELDELQSLLDQVREPLEPLDVTMLDGFLCGLLVQPVRVPDSRWLVHVTDVDGRPLPAGFPNLSRLHTLVHRRYDELNQAIAQRQWFDPWVFELETDTEQVDAASDADEAWHDGPPPEVAAVYPWVAGFATALEVFPDLIARDEADLQEPLALLYRHLDADDLEDAEALLAEIETLEPPADLGEAVEELVRATLLLADVGRPLPKPARAQPPRGGGGGRPHGAARRPPGRR